MKSKAKQTKKTATSPKAKRTRRMPSPMRSYTEIEGMLELAKTKADRWPHCGAADVVEALRWVLKYGSAPI